jgi:hypothetical protein
MTDRETPRETPWTIEDCGPMCTTCHQRIEPGQGLQPDPEQARSWTMIFCSERCKAMQAALRI